MRPPRCLKEKEINRMKDYELDPDDTSIADIIKKDDEETTKTMISLAEKLGSFVVSYSDRRERLTTSQLRNIFGEVKRLQLQARFNQRRLLLLKPRLRYMAARHGLGAKALRSVLEKGIDEVDDEREFDRFVEFFEAILCYHKAAGGR